LGIVSAWPVVYFGFFTQMIAPDLLLNGFEGQNVWMIMILHFLTFLLCCFLFVYYLIKASTSKDLGDQKTLWILGLIFLNGAAWPIYWYFNIWKKVK
jgi:hypothetical protein